MGIRLTVGPESRRALQGRMRWAHHYGTLRLVRRIEGLLMIAAGLTVAQVAEILDLGEQTVRDWVKAYLVRRLDSLVYRKPPGRPPRLTKTQKKELCQLIDDGPEAAGYASGCWTSVLVQDLILSRFQVEYHPLYVCDLLGNLGYSYQKARFVSDHLDEEARREWKETIWPEIVQLAQQTGALILFGDEASFAQWGSLSYTWSKKGQQPTVKTTGRRKAHKVFGLIDFFTGRFFYQGHQGRFNSDSYQEFLAEVLIETDQPLILIQDGARYHTSKATRAFFADHADRLTVYQLPSYSPDFNPIEYLWKKVKKRATHLKYFPAFDDLVDKVEDTLLHFAHTPAEILSLMGQYCESLGELAA